MLASTLILFYALVLFLSTLLLIAGGKISIFITPVAGFIALVYFGVLANRYLKVNNHIVLLGYFILILGALVSYLLSVTIYDLSWDGRDYHQKAIYELMQGWNPVFQLQDTGIVYRDNWLNFYPKAPWITAAAVNMLTGNIEIGKSINLFLISAVFLTAFSVLLSFSKLKIWESLLISALIALNPVSVYQSFSYYIDGQVSSIFILLVLLMVKLLKQPDLISLMMLAFTIVIGINIKLTASAYFGLVLVTFLVLFILFKRKSRYFKATIGVVVLSIALGVLVVGFNPYIKNTINFRHPFYPTYGSDTFNKEFLLSRQIPQDFRNKSWIEKVLRSVFYASQNNPQQISGSIKFPLSISISEITIFKGSDVRIAGWGPLFSLILSISFVTGILLLIRRRGNNHASWGLIILIFVTMLLNPEAWWARYAPQFWLIPIIVLVMAMSHREDSMVRLFGYLIMAVCFANVFMVSSANLAGNIIDSKNMKATLQEISVSGDEILVYYGPLDATKHKLNEYKISFKVVSDKELLPCPQQLVPNVLYSQLSCP